MDMEVDRLRAVPLSFFLIASVKREKSEIEREARASGSEARAKAKEEGLPAFLQITPPTKP